LWLLKLMSARLNVCSIVFHAILLKHCVKMCAETISWVGYRPFD
jgi:hypothetical protein